MTAEEFNDTYPVGTLVRYQPVKGYVERVDTCTRSGAWTLGHGAVVVKIEGQVGGVSIDHLGVMV